VSDFAIRASGLTKHFGAKRAVDQLSFDVPAGSIYGFLGPNGAGKTTTFSLLCGFVRPDSGDATVLGQPLQRLDRVFGRFSALPQDAKFSPSRSIEDSLRFLAELGGLDRAAAEREAGRVLAAVEMADSRHVKGKALSHGMAKRFGIAQAFLGSPELVLLDEPTEGLDPRTAHNIRLLVKSLQGRSTVLVSSHNLAEVEDICDWAAIIDRGRLVTQGKISDLTGADEQIIVSLGPGSPDPSEPLRRLAVVKAVELSPDGRRMRVALKPDGRVEDAISVVLRGVLDSGATVGSVVRGRSLEERFLELT
jgi:ABC-type multidrug transport system ATPase subunit